MTRLNPQDGYMVFINTFTVSPENAETLLFELSKATESHIKHMAGFVSANLHVSEDQRHVANYGQWRSRADYDAFLRDPKTRTHLEAAAKLVVSYKPIIYELREVASAGGAR